MPFSSSCSRQSTETARRSSKLATLVALKRGPETHGLTINAMRLDLSDLADDLLGEVYAYWIGKHKDGRLPGRCDIDPLEFPRALGRICLLEVAQDPLSFRYRVDGSLIAEHRGYDLTGKSTDEVRPLALANLLRAEYGQVVHTAEANYFKISYSRDTLSGDYRVLALPLSSDGDQVDMILVCALGTEILQTFY